MLLITFYCAFHVFAFYTLRFILCISSSDLFSSYQVVPCSRQSVSLLFCQSVRQSVSLSLHVSFFVKNWLPAIFQERVGAAEERRSLFSPLSLLSLLLSLSLPSIKERDLVSRGRSSLSHLDSIWHQIYAFTQTSVPLFRDILGHLVLQWFPCAWNRPKIPWPFHNATRHAHRCIFICKSHSVNLKKCRAWITLVGPKNVFFFFPDCSSWMGLNAVAFSQLLRHWVFTVCITLIHIDNRPCILIAIYKCSTGKKRRIPLFFSSWVCIIHLFAQLSCHWVYKHECQSNWHCDYFLSLSTRWTAF